MSLLNGIGDVRSGQVVVGFIQRLDDRSQCGGDSAATGPHVLHDRADPLFVHAADRTHLKSHPEVVAGPK